LIQETPTENRSHLGQKTARIQCGPFFSTSVQAIAEKTYNEGSERSGAFVSFQAGVKYAARSRSSSVACGFRRNKSSSKLLLNTLDTLRNGGHFGVVPNV